MVIDTFSVKEYIILEFISFMLSGAGLYSLLMYELRQKRSLVYNVGAYNDCMKYLSLFKINIATTQHDTVQIIDVVLNTINNLKTGSVVSKKLKFFKKSFESAMKLNLSNADYKCFLLGTIMFNSDNKIMINETDLMKVVKSITISDIAKNCKKIFHIDKMGIVAVGKYENPQIQANNILDSLKKWQNK
jgi:predicted Zn-dependent peptidase